MAEEGAGLRQIARVLKCSPATVRKALLAENGHVPGTWCSSGPGRVMAVISTSSLNSYQGGIHICGALRIGFGIPEEYFP